MLDRINWSEVVLDIAGKESSTTYRNAFKMNLKAQIEGILERECKVDLHIE